MDFLNLDAVFTLSNLAYVLYALVVIILGAVASKFAPLATELQDLFQTLGKFTDEDSEAGKKLSDAERASLYQEALDVIQEGLKLAFTGWWGTVAKGVMWALRHLKFWNTSQSKQQKQKQEHLDKKLRRR